MHRLFLVCASVALLLFFTQGVSLVHAGETTLIAQKACKPIGKDPTLQVEKAVAPDGDCSKTSFIFSTKVVDRFLGIEWWPVAPRNSSFVHLTKEPESDDVRQDDRYRSCFVTSPNAETILFWIVPKQVDCNDAQERVKEDPFPRYILAGKVCLGRSPNCKEVKQLSPLGQERVGAIITEAKRLLAEQKQEERERLATLPR